MTKKTKRKVKNSLNKGEEGELYAKARLVYTGFIPTLGRNLEPIDGKDMLLIKLSHPNGVSLSPEDHWINVQQGTLKKRVSPRRAFAFSLRIREMIEEYDLYKESGKVNPNKKKADLLSKPLGLYKSKTPNEYKHDISLEVINFKKERENRKASIKCFVGNKPSILNSCKATVATVEIKDLNAEAIERIRNIRGAKSIVKAIKKEGGRLVFHKYRDKKFEERLREIDPELPEVLARGVLGYATSDKSSVYDIFDGNIPEAFRKLCRASVCNFCPSEDLDPTNFVEKDLLVIFKDYTIGLIPYEDKEAWDYIICENAVIDTPSAKRNETNKIYERDGKYYIDLGFQIRIKSPKEKDIKRTKRKETRHSKKLKQLEKVEYQGEFVEIINSINTSSNNKQHQIKNLSLGSKSILPWA